MRVKIRPTVEVQTRGQLHCSDDCPYCWGSCHLFERGLEVDFLRPDWPFLRCPECTKARQVGGRK